MAAKKKPTPKQQEILTLLNRDMQVNEIADALGTSAQAVYAQISRMRSTGILPKKARNGSRPKATVPPVPSSSEQVARTNGKASLEDHLAAELEATTKRLVSIEHQQASLASEHSGLTERRDRLASASQALNGADLLPAEAAEPVAA